MTKRNLSMLTLLAFIGLSLSGCGMTASPGSTVRKFYQYMDAKNEDKALSLFSREVTDNASIDKLKAGLAMNMKLLEESGGIRSVKVVEEQITGDTAKVTVTITLGNGETSTETAHLVREEGVWKLAPSK